MYDYLIIGAGPSGLHAAGTLAYANKKVLVIDKGNNIENRICIKDKLNTDKCNCNICNVVCGFGGAGGRSDGKLLFSPNVGYNLYSLSDKKTIDIIIDKTKKIYSKLSGIKVLKNNNKKILKQKCLQNGLIFKDYEEMHIGSDRMILTMKNMKSILKKIGVDFLMNTEACFDKKKIYIRYKKKRINISAKNIVLAVGRGGYKFIDKLNKADIIKTFHKPIDIGVRLETLNEITKPITDIQYDFKIISKEHDFTVRSYCVNPNGFVVTEHYNNGKKFSLVNGHSELNKKSNNCNFAILFKAELMDPYVNTHNFGESLSMLFNCAGGGKPVVQRLLDIYLNRRSTPNRILRSNVAPTLRSATPGNLGWVMPHDFMNSIINYIKKINKIMPGIADGYNTLLYGPEIKFQSSFIEIDKNFCANRNLNLYVIGDCSGRSGSIVSAAVTGVLFANSQLKEEND